MQLPVRTVAVRRFSGAAFMSDSKRRAEALLSDILLDGHTPLQQLLQPPSVSSGQGLGMVLDGGSMRVVRVIESSRADRAGVKEGDFILQINCTAVASLQQLSSSLVSSAKREHDVVLSLRRNNQEHQVILDGPELAEAAAGGGGARGRFMSTWSLARYDSPFVPPAMRTNEILIPLREKGAGDPEGRGWMRGERESRLSSVGNSAVKSGKKSQKSASGST